MVIGVNMTNKEKYDEIRVPFVTDEGETVYFCVLEQTRFYGINYLLVSEEPDNDDAEVYILKDMSGDESTDALYEMVDDDEELAAVAGLFEDLLEEVEFEKPDQKKD